MKIEIFWLIIEEWFKQQNFTVYISVCISRMLFYKFGGGTSDCTAMSSRLAKFTCKQAEAFLRRKNELSSVSLVFTHNHCLPAQYW